jgi:hypothetical protein
LHEWSRQSPDKYNRIKNKEIYDGILFDASKAVASLTWLHNKALKGNRAAILEFVYPVHPIFNQTNGIFFSQYLKFCRECNIYNNMLAHAGDFIRKTIGYIINGGNLFYITKNLLDSQVIYDFAKGLQGMNDTISCTKNLTEPPKITIIVDKTTVTLIIVGQLNRLKAQAGWHALCCWGSTVTRTVTSTVTRSQ